MKFIRIPLHERESNWNWDDVLLSGMSILMTEKSHFKNNHPKHEKLFPHNNIKRTIFVKWVNKDKKSKICDYVQSCAYIIWVKINTQFHFWCLLLFHVDFFFSLSLALVLFLATWWKKNSIVWLLFVELFLRHS